MYRYPDRRRHVRVLTLKNFGWAMLVLVVGFAVISIRSEFTNSDPKPGQYGRLYDHEVLPVAEQAPPEVVREEGQPVDDQDAADPMLVQPAARAQWLTGEEPEPVATTAAPTRVEASTTGSGPLAIVGDSSGVSVVQHDRAKPQLSGGFGRRY